MSRPSGPGHGLQNSRPGGDQTAQGALLSGTSRRRVRAENGGGPVCLSRGPGPEEGRSQVEESQVEDTGQGGGDRLLRRKAGDTGHRDDGAGFAARARRPSGLCARFFSRETRAWLDTRPAGRFEFTFTPKHGSWLNLIEGFFSKFTRSVLRHIRVTSK